MAFIALIAIVIGIIWTWVLVIAGWSHSGEVEYSEEEIQAIIDSFSWASITWTWENLEDIDIQENLEDVDLDSDQ